MLFAYILTKAGYWKRKAILGRGATLFIWKGCEYQIDRTKLRTIRWLLGLKIAFALHYDQDNPIPLDFDAGVVVRPNQDIPINELAYFANLLRGQLFLIVAICAIAGAVCAGLAMYYGYTNFKQTQEVLDYLRYMNSNMRLWTNTTALVIP